MNWEEIKSAVLAYFERMSQIFFGYQQQEALRPIPIETRRRDHHQQ